MNQHNKQLSAMDNIFDNIETEPDLRSDFEKKVWEAYGSNWGNRALMDGEYPPESVCDKCTGCGTFQFEGEEKECVVDKVEGRCYHRYFDAEGFGLEVENILINLQQKEVRGEEGIYDSVYMEVVKAVEDDNIQGGMYSDTIEKLKRLFIIQKK